MPYSIRPFPRFTVQSLVTIAILYLVHTPVHAGLCMPPDVQKDSLSSPLAGYWESVSKNSGYQVSPATVSNMWEVAVIVDLLERKGLCTKQDLYSIITEFRCKEPRARIPETAFAKPYILTETEKMTIENILDLFNTNYE